MSGLHIRYKHPQIILYVQRDTNLVMWSYVAAVRCGRNFLEVTMMLFAVLGRQYSLWLEATTFEMSYDRENLVT